MEIFNIGVGELLFVIILAFILLGPERMIEAAGQLGKVVRKLVNSPVWKEINKGARDLDHLSQEILDKTGVNDSVETIRNINQEIAKINLINLDPDLKNKGDLEQISDDQIPKDNP